MPNPTTFATPTVRRRKNVRSLRRRDGLIRHARDTTSQNGEDGVISRIFELLQSNNSDEHDQRDDSSATTTTTTRRYCVDIGAWDGVHLSNTHSLLVDGGGENGGGEGKHVNSPPPCRWSGVLVEADAERFQSLRALHEPLGNTCVLAEVSADPDSASSLVKVLRREAPHLPRDFDFLCIDVDGGDYWLLADVLLGNSDGDDDGGGCDNGGGGGGKGAHYRPKVVCVEFNPTMPTDLIYIQPRNDSARHGSSLSALVELANSANYILVETTLFNAFFVTRELYDAHLKEEVPDTSIEALHEISMGTEMYQLYDGTLKLWGCKRMLWHRMPMDEGKMQMLNEEKREFPFAPPADGPGNAGETTAEQIAMSNGGAPSPEVEAKEKADASARDNARKAHNRKIVQSAIDVSPYCRHSNSPSSESSDDDQSNQRERRHTTASLLREALRNDGFALVRGTGISSTLCRAALRATSSFLRDADESVRRSCLTKDRARRGYSPMCTENFASLVGDRGVANDLVRKFRVGSVGGFPSTDGGGGESEVSAEYPASSFALHQPNAWPTSEAWDGESAAFFRLTIEAYFEASRRAADAVVRAIIDGVVAENSGLEDSLRVFVASEDGESSGDGNVDAVDRHSTILTLLGYQTGSRHKKGSKGYGRPLVAPHTDVGVVTFLHFDGGGGSGRDCGDNKCAVLQRAAGRKLVEEQGDEETTTSWVDVALPRLDGASMDHHSDGVDDDDDPVFVVNVGDCLSELSDGALRSTLHRVMPRTATATNTAKRRSNNDDETARACLATFVGLEPEVKLIMPSTGEEMSYEEWRKRRIARASAVLRK